MKKKDKDMQIKNKKYKNKQDKEQPDAAPIKRRRRPRGATFIGYCSNCKCMIMQADRVSTFIYQCPSCEKKERTKYLKLEISKKKLQKDNKTAK